MTIMKKKKKKHLFEKSGNAVSTAIEKKRRMIMHALYNIQSYFFIIDFLSLSELRNNKLYALYIKPFFNNKMKLTIFCLVEELVFLKLNISTLVFLVFLHWNCKY